MHKDKIKIGLLLSIAFLFVLISLFSIVGSMDSPFGKPTNMISKGDIQPMPFEEKNIEQNNYIVKLHN